MANPPIDSGVQRSVDIERLVVVSSGYRQIDGKTVAVFRFVQQQYDPADHEFAISWGDLPVIRHWLAPNSLSHSGLRKRGIAHEQTLRAVQEWPE